MTSPYRDLGILPSIIEGFNGEQLVELVKHTGRSLQLFFHTDHEGGEQDRSSTINLAMGVIDNPVNAEDHKERYLREGPGQREVRTAESSLLQLIHSKCSATVNLLKSGNEAAGTKAEGEWELAGRWINSMYSTYMGWTIDMDELGTFPYLHLRFSASREFTYVDTGADMSKEIGKHRLEQLDTEKARILRSPEYKEAKEHFDTTLPALVKALEQVTKKRKLTKQDCEVIGGELAGPHEELIGKILPESAEEAVKEHLRHWIDEYTRQYKHYSDQLDTIEEQIKGTKKRMREKSKVRRIRVDKNGCISYSFSADAPKSKYLVVGSLNEDPRNSLIFDVEDQLFYPHVIMGKYLAIVDEHSRLHIVGLLQKFQGQDELGESGPQADRKASPELTLGEEEPELSDETAVAPTEPLQIQYKKNPLETLGILPELVEQLSADELKEHVKKVSTVLKRITHSDFFPGDHEGDPTLFHEVSEAEQLLDKKDIFKQARLEYLSSSPGAGKIAAIQEEMDRTREEIKGLISDLAASKQSWARKKREYDKNTSRKKAFVTLLLKGLLSSDLHPDDYADSYYLHRSAGVQLIVSTPEGEQEFELRRKGFDVFADSGEVTFRLMGSTLPGDFESAEQAGSVFSDILALHSGSEVLAIHFQPVLHPGGVLLAVDDEKNGVVPVAIGTIEDIQRAKATARKIKKKKPPKTKPPKRRRTK